MPDVQAEEGKLNPEEAVEVREHPREVVEGNQCQAKCLMEGEEEGTVLYRGKLFLSRSSKLGWQTTSALYVATKVTEVNHVKKVMSSFHNGISLLRRAEILEASFC